MTVGHPTVSSDCKPLVITTCCRGVYKPNASENLLCYADACDTGYVFNMKTGTPADPNYCCTMVTPDGRTIELVFCRRHWYLPLHSLSGPRASAPSKPDKHSIQWAALANNPYASLLDLTDAEDGTDTVWACHGSLIVQADLTVEQRMQLNHDKH